MATTSHNPEQISPTGIAHAGVIDYLGFDSKSQSVLLVMAESRPWTQPQDQLFQLQEKLNAYMSFVLDGEMLEAYPQFAQKAVLIRFETVEKPPEVSFDFFQHVYEQCSLQGINFEVVVKNGGCGCGKPSGECTSS